MKLCVLFFLFSGSTVWALPSSARLFQTQYGYRVSCNLCHSSGGGSSLGKYGKDFFRSGSNSAAFKKIEDKDSDEDGIPNIKEILAKSNAGDAKSIPSLLGDWLANVGAIYIPKKELESLFPGYSSFSAVEGSLNEKQIEFYKSKLGIEPSDDDKVPTFYFAEKDGKREAVAQLLSEKNTELTLNTGIAVSLSGQIVSIRVLGGSGQKNMEKDKNALEAFNGKNLTNLPPESTSSEGKLLRRTVLRNLYLVQAVFGGVGK